MYCKNHAENNVSFMGCDFMKDELPKNSDIILGFNIIHGLNAAENEELAKRCTTLLVPEVCTLYWTR